jgi:hypothetical protein
MSCYVCSNETISVIANAFSKYRVIYYEDFRNKPSIYALYPNSVEVAKIGQSLLNQNYRSVNERYNEDTPTPAFELKKIENVNEGMIVGCINNYMYQACETEDWIGSAIYISLNNLKNAVLEQMIRDKGQEIVWGID